MKSDVRINTGGSEEAVEIYVRDTHRKSRVRVRKQGRPEGTAGSSSG